MESYTRPPLPPPPPPPQPAMAASHHQHQLQIPPPPPGQPSYQQNFGYSSQFHYNPPPSSSSLPPPPSPYQHLNQQHQWNPPPPVYSDQYPPAVYPPPPPPPHHSYPPHQQYPPHPPPPHQAYPHVNQEWGNNPNWAHYQAGEYPVQSIEDDWAARAKAWAASNASTDYQNVHPQSTPFGRAEEQTQYHDQHPQPVDSQYAQTQHQTHASSSYHQFQVTPTHRSPVFRLQESPSISSGSASYVPDGHSSYSAGDSNAAFHHRENLAATETYQQEVPSSYSSVPGNLGAGSAFPITSHQDGHYHAQPLPAIARSELMERSFVYRNHSAGHRTDLSDQPLDFAPSFNRAHEHQMQSSFPQHNIAGTLGAMDPVTVAAPIHTWGPSNSPETVYPSLPSGSQHDPSTTFLGRIPGPGFHPPVSSVSAPFDLGARPALYSTTAFPGDAYGVSNISDRPKKAAVPNWLREEIIKKKDVIASFAQEKNNEDARSIEDEVVENSIGRGDQADSKSIDSSRSNEEEDDDDDDEDHAEAARTAAINQEIKRILTEVLLKVTDELFDEIATKVLSEDGVMAEVNHDTLTIDHKASSPLVAPLPKASANVLMPANSMDYKIRAATAKSSSNTPGDILGLGSYKSDDDDDEIQTSIKPKSRENSVDRHLSIKRNSEEIQYAGVDAGSQANAEVQDRYQEHLENVYKQSSPSRAKTSKSAVTSELKNIGSASSSKEISGVKGDVTGVGEIILDGVSGSEIIDKYEERTARKSEMPGKEVNDKNLMTDSHVKEASTKSDKNGRYETQLSSTGKDYLKEVESNKITKYAMEVENHVKRDGSHPQKEKIDGCNGSKGKKKDEGASIEKKTKESDSKRKDVNLDAKNKKYETESGKKARAKEDHDKKREHGTGGKEDASKYKPQSSSSKHKRRRSPVVESNARHSKDKSIVSRADSTSDDASEDSRRKLHSKRRNLSPSPVRSKKRQVSRSPHSKHSQHRHSPYSSLETTRKRRSRSRSPRRRR